MQSASYYSSLEQLISNLHVSSAQKLQFRITSLLTNCHCSIDNQLLSCLSLSFLEYWLIEEGLTSHQTHYRSYRGQVFTGQMTQPTVSKHWRNDFQFFLQWCRNSSTQKSWYPVTLRLLRTLIISTCQWAAGMTNMEQWSTKYSESCNVIRAQVA